MALLEPFTGYVPASEFAHRIVGPPVSTLSPHQREEARADPLSFRHVVGRGAGTSNAEARTWLAACEQMGALRPVGPIVVVYRLAKGNLVATGIIADVALAAYDAGRIKGHEATIEKTQKKMVRYMAETRVFGNPVALAHRPHQPFSAAIAEHTRRESDFSFIAADGFAHAMWAIRGDAAHELCASFDDDLYITDGHHRLAAASAVAAAEGRGDPHLPAGLFSMDEQRLGAFARCVLDPELDVEAAIDTLRSKHRLEEVGIAEARPRQRYEYGVKMGGRSYRLHIDRSLIPDDVYEALDVSVLQRHVLEPIFGITDPSTDNRLRFVPDSGNAEQRAAEFTAWFMPFPASIRDVIAVADLGKNMPPKSTLFTPKLPSGLVVRLLDRD